MMLLVLLLLLLRHTPIRGRAGIGLATIGTGEGGGGGGIYALGRALSWSKSSHSSLTYRGLLVASGGVKGKMVVNRSMGVGGKMEVGERSIAGEKGGPPRF